MKRIIDFSLVLILTVLLAGMSSAQDVRSFVLKNSVDGESKVYAFLPQHGTGRAVVVLPGGGYSHLAMQHEGTSWAPWFNDRGIACFVLKYRMPNGNRELPLSDAMNAIKTVRDSAKAWHINPYDIGIMGSSAGGHLASAVSTHAPLAMRPNFSILFYPVISMDEHLTHKGSVKGFLGDSAQSRHLINEWSSNRAVRRHLTPRAVILLANDDQVVPPVDNGIAYYSAMRKCGNECALYVYPTGGHGFGFNTSFAFHDQMLSDLDSWLKSFKAPLENSIRVACIGNSITDGSGIDMSDAKGYPAQLQQLLGDKYNVRNFGVSARTMLNNGDHPYMKELAWRDALAFQPDIAVIKLGTNDSKPRNWQYGANFGKDMQQMIDSLRQLPSKPKIYLCSPIPAFKTQWGINDSTITAGVIPVIKKLAKKNHLQFIDLHTTFKDFDNKQIQQDGIHPTAKGAGQMARIIADALKNELVSNKK